MQLWTGLLLGLLGSVHCAGMCGPLALALPHYGRGASSFYAGRIGYNLGRITAYACLGLVFGVLGRSIALAGLQRWVSLVAGAAILISLIPASRRVLGRPVTGAILLLKSRFSSVLQQRTLAAPYLLGVLNGFLPCGLVYVACAGALALGSVRSGVAYMLAFGLGTVPVMLGIGTAGRKLQIATRFRRLVPVGVVLVGALLLLRGLSLGIPYLSPELSAFPGAGHACH